jgi:oligopeptide transport system ATP-binding protein
MALVEVRNLVKHFERGGGLFRARSVVRAVDDVSFTVDEGETFALVGESGSGKSTTGRCMLRLVEPSSGQVLFRGENVLGFSSARMRAARRDLQMVFQDPYSSLNPRMRAFTIVEEPLVIHDIGTRADSIPPTSISTRSSSAAASASASGWRAPSPSTRRSSSRTNRSRRWTSRSRPR